MRRGSLPLLLCRPQDPVWCLEWRCAQQLPTAVSWGMQTSALLSRLGGLPPFMFTSPWGAPVRDWQADVAALNRFLRMRPHLFACGGGGFRLAPGQHWVHARRTRLPGPAACLRQAPRQPSCCSLRRSSLHCGSWPRASRCVLAAGAESFLQYKRSILQYLERQPMMRAASRCAVHAAPGAWCSTQAACRQQWMSSCACSQPWKQLVEATYGSSLWYPSWCLLLPCTLHRLPLLYTVS